MNDISKYSAMEPPHWGHCDKAIAFRETVFSIDVMAEEFLPDGTVSPLGATNVLTVCRTCADETDLHALWNPFRELLAHFG